MKTFQIVFTGRLCGAIGIRYTISETVQATDKNSAILKLYDKYEHISVIKIKEEQ